VQTALAPVYVLTFVLSVCGNLLVIYVVLLSKDMRRSVCNYFIANLAVADLLQVSGLRAPTHHMRV
jgi:hypothetical protein